MGHIEGNTQARIQIRSVEPDEYALDREVWKDAFPDPLIGVLDLTSADVSSRLMKRVEESDYIFLCDYRDLRVDGEKLTTENSRILIDGEVYEVLLYDDPMRMHEHLEIYLKYVGGQEDGR
ncbi:MAG: hypothetical protein NC305_13320 [Lachnospiraceae bacterium]|nr:hypothetical protein [Butyrivibrio sp.]MCM1344022.1 hypothetical protein [Muribaculaceae bacterium]MCM1411511.1 hypothetical protein [Lachnospiraceae bacterium]